MQKIFIGLLLLFPGVICSQSVWNLLSPLDYMWMNVGEPGFSADSADYTSLAIDPSGHPYIAFGDVANQRKATVMKFEGNSWSIVGTAGFSSGSAVHTSLALSGSGQPYVAYSDGGNSNKATVMTFNGTSWVNLGAAGFSSSAAKDITILISPLMEPYVALNPVPG